MSTIDHANRITSIIMAGGLGTRMGEAPGHKVCQDIEGIPAIQRTIDTFEACGVHSHVVVIGAESEDLVHAVGSRYANALFVYQPQPRGTGNAAKCGCRALRSTGYDGLVLVTAGDKAFEPRAVLQLIEAFAAAQADSAIIVGRKEDFGSSGRVVTDDLGRPTAIVEVGDIRLSALLQELVAELPAEKATSVATAPILEALLSRFKPNKAAKAFGSMYERLQAETELSSGEFRAFCLQRLRQLRYTIWQGGQWREMPASEAESVSQTAHLCVHLHRAEVLYDAVERIGSVNAQGEEYITDAIGIISGARNGQGTPRYRLIEVPIADPRDVQGYNSQIELDSVRQYYRARYDWQETVTAPELTRASYRTVSDWKVALSSEATTMRSAVLAHARRFGGADRAVIVRCPGRINLLGRHTDHRGGTANMMAIGDEQILVCAPRQDDIIVLKNADRRQYVPSCFSVAAELSGWMDRPWLEFVSDPGVMAQVKASTVKWANYVKAAALRLQHTHPDRRLHGMHVTALGTIPPEAGLSSSSALVVAAMRAIVALNGLAIPDAELVDLAAQAEWYVGTRGGSSDHAAMLSAERGHVAQLDFFPFRISRSVPFPAGYSVAVCDSGIRAKKQARAGEVYNSRVLGYTIGEIMLRRLFPEHASNIEHLRDVNCETLGVGVRELYRMVAALPMMANLWDMWEIVGDADLTDEEERRLDAVLTAVRVREGDRFDIRNIILYGIAECERSRRCADLLAAGDMDALGTLWRVSHDGDRVVAYDAELNQVPWEWQADDATMQQLIAMAGETPTPRAADIALVPGRYACSTPEIDCIVDAVGAVPGVKGAQIAGAGLGGCVLILMADEATEAVRSTLSAMGLTLRVYTPAAKAGLVQA